MFNAEYGFFIGKRVLRKIPEDEVLVRSHLQKTWHNMQLFDKNKGDEQL